MLIVDSHCHLNFPDFKEDLPAVIARAREQGVRVMQTICTEMAEFPEILAIAEANEGVYCSVGVHPNDSAKAPIANVDELVAAARHPKVIGLGETGLDYHYETAPRALQQESFLNHIIAARETGLPLIIHTRDAEEDTARILREEMARGPFKALLHCFTSSMWLAEVALELGLSISFSGIVTFKSAADLRAVAAMVPLERMLVETDAPFLAPLPYRGKRNEPAFTRNTAEFLAELRGISLEELAQATTENFFRVFHKATMPEGVGLAA